MSPLETASALARRLLDPARVEALRNVYLGARMRLAPLIRAVHGRFDTAMLRQHLEQKVGRDFQVLMVHSSVNHMKPMYDGTPLELVRMLVDFCGPDRTLVMPAFYFGENGVGAYDGFVRNPRFDLRRTPSQMGLATELFRRMPTVRWSRHPVYRVSALGPHAEEIVRGHEHADGPAGRGSPFEAMARLDACILGIGKPVQVMTQAHHAEGWLGSEFPGALPPPAPLPMTLVDRDGEIAFELRSQPVDGTFDIWRVRTVLRAGTLQEWSFHHVPMFSAGAGEVTRQLIDAARRGVTLYRRDG